jgi:hypothetical protein
MLRWVRESSRIPKYLGMAESSARHARESAAKVGKRFGVSRESVRKTKVIRERAPELFARMNAGRLELEAAYRELTGDDRRAVYLKLPRDLERRLRAFSGSLATDQLSLPGAILKALDDLLPQVPS